MSQYDLILFFLYEIKLSNFLRLFFQINYRLRGVPDMSYSSLILSSKLSKFTALALALSLAGCGGDGTDTLPPRPDLGVSQPGGSVGVTDDTGRVTQNGFSVSLTKNVLAFGADGDTADITARLVDRVGNPIPDGAVITFVSEGGRVTPSCITTNGVCTVEFSTQNPRPADNRVSVLAYVKGDKSYVDMNANNEYDIGVDTLRQNIGDFFRDDNENTLYDSNIGEFLYQVGDSGATCAPSSFNEPNVVNTCDNNLPAVLRYQFVLGLAENNPTFVDLPTRLTANPTTPTTPTNSSIVNFSMYGNSERTISMASGTTISVDGGSCSAKLTTNNATVPDIVRLGVGSVSINDVSVSYGFSYTGCESGTEIEVTVTTPSPFSTTTTKTISIQ